MAPAHDLAELARRVVAGRGVVAGVLSGTSADGIDVALVRFPPAPGPGPGPGAAPALGRPELLAFGTRPFPAELHRRVRAVLDGGDVGLRASALLDRDLGRAFGDAARELARERGLALALVASHGQTVWHHDGTDPAGAATRQLGDGDFVAAAAGAVAVSDFRAADVAAGGEGAPLSPLADGLLFADLPRPAAVLNLGGMANLTLLGAGGAVAFDTGPAGSLLDGLARRLLDRAWDEGGAVAAGGQSDPALVDAFLEHPFFDRAPPKSTGRDTFGERWVERFLAAAQERGLGTPDALASGVELVARSVALGLARFGGRAAALDAAAPGARAGARAGARRFDRLVVAGGGLGNRALQAALARSTGLPVVSSAAFGVDPDAREAMVFAVLGARALAGIPSFEPGATGARRPAVLGKLSRPGLPVPDGAPGP